jgi:hypothetical protein
VEPATDDIGERLTRIERDTQVERLLQDLNSRRLLPG